MVPLKDIERLISTLPDPKDRGLLTRLVLEAETARTLIRQQVTFGLLAVELIEQSDNLTRAEKHRVEFLVEEVAEATRAYYLAIVEARGGDELRTEREGGHHG